MLTRLYIKAANVLADKKGAAMVEYALLAGLIAVVAITALTTLGSNVKTTFSSIATSV